MAFALWTSFPISSDYSNSSVVSIALYVQHSAIHRLHVWLSKMTKLDRTRFSCLLSDRCCNGPCCGWCGCTILSNDESPVVMRRSGCTTDWPPLALTTRLQPAHSVDTLYMHITVVTLMYTGNVGELAPYLDSGFIISGLNNYVISQ